MQLIENGTQGATSPPAPGPVSGTPGYGNAGTILDNDHYNIVLQELANLAGSTSVALSAGDNGQILKAVKTLTASNLTALSATTSLTINHSGVITVDATGGNVALALPAANAAGAGVSLRFLVIRIDTSGNGVAVNRSSTDTFMPGAGTSSTLSPGDAVLYVGDGSAHWRVMRKPVITLVTATGSIATPAGAVDCVVDGVGMGGAGGGTPTTAGGQAATGGGGGSGAWGTDIITTLTNLTATVPAVTGSVGTGAAGANGNAGANTVLSGDFGTFTFPAGSGGTAGSAISLGGTGGGNGGTQSTQSGGTALDLPAGNAGQVGQVWTASNYFGGAGAPSPYGSGGGPTSGTSAGSAGLGYGSGGSGAATGASNASTQAGGNAAPGMLRLTFRFGSP